MLLFIETFTSFLLLCNPVTNLHPAIKTYIKQNFSYPQHLKYCYDNRLNAVVLYKDNDTKTIEKLVIPWLLYYTNKYRKEHGLDTLVYDDCLAKAAGYQSDYLFNESKKNHQFKLVHIQNPASEWFKGGTPSDRALTAGCKKYCGENALYTTIATIPPVEFKNRQQLNAAAQKIAKDMVYDLWHNSIAHRENMLTSGYTCLGVSVAIAKHYAQAEAGYNSKDENNNVSWIAFGIQVMAY